MTGLKHQLTNKLSGLNTNFNMTPSYSAYKQKKKEGRKKEEQGEQEEGDQSTLSQY